MARLCCGASLEVIATLYNMTDGEMPIVGVGGVFNADDAWQMISAGASLLQIYTGFIYEGPAIARNINDGLRRIISERGFVSLDEAVGSRAAELATGVVVLLRWQFADTGQI